MILVADSGSTKTAWQFIDDNGKISAFSTIGFNPYFWSSAAIYKEIIKHCPKRLKHQISSPQCRIYYYGAGCSSPKRIAIVRTALKKAFPKSKIHVHHDLLGSARAVCGSEKGIAAILGTGSNSCLYDGEKVVYQHGGWGYIISDEGSGADMGKKLMQDFINGALAEDLHEKLASEYRLTREKVVDAVYNQPYANRFLASFGSFIQKNVNDSYCRNLAKTCLTAFFDNHICRYENYRETPMGCVGSIGFYFRNLLEEIAGERQVRLGKIIRSPIEELVKYHLNSGD